MKYLFCVFLLFVFHYNFAQKKDSVRVVPDAYIRNMEIADSLSGQSEFRAAWHFYTLALNSWNQLAIIDDRFKMVRVATRLEYFDSAFYHLTKLADSRYFYNFLPLELDGNFTPLRAADPFLYDSLVAQIKANKRRYAPEYDFRWARIMDSILTEDQSERSDWIAIEQKYGPDSEQAIAKRNKVAAKDSTNLIAVQQLLEEKKKWPGKSIVGWKGSRAVFLVIQHSRIPTMERYLPWLRKAVKEQEANSEDLGLMEDRVSLAKYGYQLYGSQLELDTDGKLKVSPIKDEKNVDRRRKERGMMPLKEYLKISGIDYQPPK